MQTIQYTRGDTWEPAIAMTDDAGEPLSLAGWQIASQIRTPGGALVAALTVANRNDSAGTFKLTVPTTHAEASWPVGDNWWSIRFTDPAGRVSSMPKIVLATEPEVTKP